MQEGIYLQQCLNIHKKSFIKIIDERGKGCMGFPVRGGGRR